MWHKNSHETNNPRCWTSSSAVNYLQSFHLDDQIHNFTAGCIRQVILWWRRCNLQSDFFTSCTRTLAIFFFTTNTVFYTCTEKLQQIDRSWTLQIQWQKLKTKQLLLNYYTIIIYTHAQISSFGLTMKMSFFMRVFLLIGITIDW